MLIARKINYPEDSEKVIKILKEENIDDKNIEIGIVYVLEEDGEIIGICKINDISPTTGILSFIVITQDNDCEELKDGILRSTLNYCYTKGIIKVYSIGKNDFLLKEGFTYADIDDVEEKIRRKIDSKVVLECNVREFFDKGCPSYRRN